MNSTYADNRVFITLLAQPAAAQDGGNSDELERRGLELLNEQSNMARARPIPSGKKATYSRRGEDKTQMMRAAKEIADLKTKNVSLQSDCDGYKEREEKLIATIPLAAKICGKRPQRFGSKHNPLTMDKCEVMLMVAYMRGPCPALGVQLHRVKACLCQAATNADSQGVLRLFRVLADIKRSDENACIVVLYEHQFDGTAQPISGIPHEILGRIDQTVLVEVIVHCASLHVSIMRDWDSEQPEVHHFEDRLEISTSV